MAGLRLNGILDEIDEDTADLRLISINQNILSFSNITTTNPSIQTLLAGQLNHLGNQFIHHQGLLDRPCHTSQFTI